MTVQQELAENRLKIVLTLSLVQSEAAASSRNYSRHAPATTPQ